MSNPRDRARREENARLVQILRHSAPTAAPGYSVRVLSEYRGRYPETLEDMAQKIERTQSALGISAQVHVDSETNAIHIRKDGETLLTLTPDSEAGFRVIPASRVSIGNIPTRKILQDITTAYDEFLE